MKDIMEFIDRLLSESTIFSLMTKFEDSVYFRLFFKDEVAIGFYMLLAKVASWFKIFDFKKIYLLLLLPARLSIFFIAFFITEPLLLLIGKVFNLPSKAYSIILVLLVIFFIRLVWNQMGIIYIKVLTGEANIFERSILIILGSVVFPYSLFVICVGPFLT